MAVFIWIENKGPLIFIVTYSSITLILMVQFVRIL